jgi:acid phosphatase family membrane protein YuiD
MKKSSPPDLAQGEFLRDLGTAKAIANVPSAYSSAFNSAADLLLDGKGHVTTDSIVALVGMPDGHPSAIGALMRAFAKKNSLRVTHYTKSTRPSCHAAVIAVWARV